MQLATVDGEGRPHVRTVVFRGFADVAGGKAMQFITDARSAKVQQKRDAEVRLFDEDPNMLCFSFSIWGRSIRT